MRTHSYKTTIIIFLVSHLLGFVFVVNAEDGAPGVETTKGECLYCTVAVVDVMLADFQGYESYRCLTDESQEGDGESEMSYRLNLPSYFISANKGLLDTGLSTICIKGGSAVRTEFGSPDYVIIPPGANIRVVQSRARQRRLLTTGSRSVLLVRVSTPNETYVDSAAVLANVTFGIGGQQTHLASQFSACSAGKLTITAAAGFPNTIVNGVMELKLSSTVKGANVRNLENSLVTMVKDALGVSDLKTTFDNVLFCMPPGTTDQKGHANWVAYTYQLGSFSYYNNVWCTSLSAKMHEMGHSLGVKHSGENGLEYSDTTCSMGSSQGPANGGERGPLMCFNGHKNYVLGWYADKQIKLDPAANGPWIGNLIGFVDYSNAYQDEYVLVSVGNLYIQYNVATKFNSGVKKYKNRVSIVSAESDTATSEIIGTVVAKQSIVIGDYVIGVCQVVNAMKKLNNGYMQLSVRLSTQDSLCGSTTSPAIPPTTRRPTLLPITFQPTTLRPTMTPTRQKTMAPLTLSPIEPPSMSPTTILPTMSATPAPLSPTISRSETPTHLYSMAPSLAPSLAPTHSPTLMPSNTATTAPVTPKPTKAPTITSRPTATSSPSKARSITPSPADTQSPVLVLPPRFCFSGEANVQVKDVGITLMKDLQIGDEVLTASGKYEQVYSFGHRHKSIKSEYIKFLPCGLEMTREHMVMIGGGRFVPASFVHVGDELESIEDGVTVTVESIETVIRSGAYAPFTASGTIVVNNAKASTYIAFQESDRLMVGGWKTPLTFQWIAHMSQSPHRIIVALGLSSGSEEEYTELGMSSWISGPYAFAVWVLEQNGVIMSMVLIPAMGLGVMSMAAEYVLVHSFV